MKPSSSAQRLTPFTRHTKSPLKHELKPQHLAFKAAPLAKVVQIYNTLLPQVYSTHQVNPSKNSSQQSLGLTRLSKVILTPDKTLQFSRRNSGIKRPS